MLTAWVRSVQGGASMRDRAAKRDLLSHLVLYRILSLAILLDRMPQHCAMPSDAPFVFRLGGTVKSTEALIMGCLHDSLKGMGHLVKHLDKLKYRCGSIELCSLL